MWIDERAWHGDNSATQQFAARPLPNRREPDSHRAIGISEHEQGQGAATGRGHGHAHSHDPGSISVSRHTKRIVMAILFPAMLLTLVGVVLLWPGSVAKTSSPADGGQRAYGDVVAVRANACPTATSATPTTPNEVCGDADVRITDGHGVNRTVTVDLPSGPGAPVLAVGDQVVLSYVPATQATPEQYSVTDHQRGNQMIFVLVLCAAVVVAFGRLQGAAALVGLGVSFAALLVFIIPGILTGESPLLVAIVGSAAVMFIVLYMTHGINVTTSVAILGTLAALILTGLLGAGFTALLHLTGFGTEESVYLSAIQITVDMRGLLLAGIIIGALGVLYDVTVTQAITVAELSQSSMSRLELYRAGSRVGRAHIASAVNTIVLAYAGASLPLLLLVAVSGQSVGDLVTSQLLAQEIVQTAVGTIGLVAAVPVTTGLAALVADVHPHRARR
jgi:uncharacterized membrane protein